MLCRFICHARFRENCRPIVLPMTVTCPYAALSVSHRPSVRFMPLVYSNRKGNYRFRVDIILDSGTGRANLRSKIHRSRSVCLSAWHIPFVYLLDVV